MTNGDIYPARAIVATRIVQETKEICDGYGRVISELKHWVAEVSYARPGYRPSIDTNFRIFIEYSDALAHIAACVDANRALLSEEAA